MRKPFGSKTLVSVDNQGLAGVIAGSPPPHSYLAQLIDNAWASLTLKKFNIGRSSPIVMEISITSVIIRENTNTAVVHIGIVSSNRYDGESKVTWEKDI